MSSGRKSYRRWRDLSGPGNENEPHIWKKIFNDFSVPSISNRLDWLVSEETNKRQRRTKTRQLTAIAATKKTTKHEATDRSILNPIRQTKKYFLFNEKQFCCFFKKCDSLVCCDKKKFLKIFAGGDKFFFKFILTNVAVYLSLLNGFEVKNFILESF